MEVGNNVTFAGASVYSKLLWWETYNFMSIEYAHVEFDETGILNIKGYNDSGKSALLKALEVLMYNRYPSSQVSFILDDKEYFDIRAGFSDGVIVRKIKYLNGQGVYEMYKDNQLIFSTKKDGVLTRITGVPQVIEDYFGVIHYEDMFLNSRGCNDKQLLVQTTGSENYRFVNSVLHTEEISLANELLNTDKNALSASKTQLEAKLSLLRAQANDLKRVTPELISKLKAVDKEVDVNEERKNELDVILETLSSVDSVLVPPSLPSLDISRLDMISSIADCLKATDIVVPPEITKLDDSQLSAIGDVVTTLSNLKAIQVSEVVPVLDATKLDLLSSIVETNRQLGGISVPAKVDTLDYEKLDLLGNIQSVLNELRVWGNKLDAQTEELQGYRNELKEYNAQFESMGIKTVVCDNCGTVMEVE